MEGVTALAIRCRGCDCKQGVGFALFVKLSYFAAAGAALGAAVGAGVAATVGSVVGAGVAAAGSLEG